MELLNRRRYGGRKSDLPRSNQIFYTTNDGNTISVHNYWTQPILNEYDKKKDMGVMVFENPLTEIPGISGHPFLFGQTNLLSLKLPQSITKLGRSPFWNCVNLYYINLIDLVNLGTIDQDAFSNTGLTKIDLRKTKITHLPAYVITGWDKFQMNVEYALFPTTIKTIDGGIFGNNSATIPTIKTLMIPTLTSQIGFVENVVTENLIINKFDGLGGLHYFNTDCIIWVPDEFYDGYIEKYTNNADVENWQDIISRLRKYSEGVPQFPYK